MRTLNLGILAHVDAGKTTLTERLLYAVGVIDAVGSVDDGTTQTDSLALERQRGITIKSAVVSFAIDDVAVSLIDTPGHPDFIAEVERALSVLDGAVLMISAVEGVQPQTRVLMRALKRLRVPTLMFVNKIDRAGAGDERVLQAVSERLTPAIVPMGTGGELGTRAACFTLFGGDDPAFRVRDGQHAGSVVLRAGCREQGDRCRGIRAWTGCATSVRLGRRDREALGSPGDPDRRPDRREGNRGSPPSVPAADARVGRRSSQS